MLSVLHQVSRSAQLKILIDPLLLTLPLENLGYGNKGAKPLSNLLWDIKYPHTWYDNDVEQFIHARRKLTAANEP
ncbi:hypothetical protein [Ensifer adhaerens]|uniref:hypothetical protein n=1 Tax=Ensifer adhaerens TaxID=106592 RepID=UPI001CC0C6C1|nr:hypothetical protein [Ensifer adhaerens]MBZ7927762.1 hypothetical protein [Ensifer adhaerens]